jgi:phage gp16-like protein
MASKNDIIKIHIAINQLGLADSEYRNILADLFRLPKAKQSSKNLSPVQCARLLRHFQAMGWKPQQQQKLPTLSVPADGQSQKILALWITLHKARVVKDGSDQALMRFVKRMTKTETSPGRDHLKWCDGQDKFKVIEALKEWAKREDVSLG